MGGPGGSTPPPTGQPDPMLATADISYRVVVPGMVVDYSPRDNATVNRLADGRTEIVWRPVGDQPFPDVTAVWDVS
jgi:hypothetical protein